MKTLIVACLLIGVVVYAADQARVGTFVKNREECRNEHKENLIAVGKCLMEKEGLVKNGNVKREDIVDALMQVVQDNKKEQVRELVRKCWGEVTELPITDEDQLGAIILCSISVTRMTE